MEGCHYVPSLYCGLGTIDKTLYFYKHSRSVKGPKVSDGDDYFFFTEHLSWPHSVPSFRRYFPQLPFPGIIREFNPALMVGVLKIWLHFISGYYAHLIASLRRGGRACSARQQWKIFFFPLKK